MQKPCHGCPFRSDGRFHLDSDRVDGIGDSLKDNGFFPCHMTIGFNDRNFCIGAISVLDREDDALSNMLIRMMVGRGRIQYPIAHDVPVYESFAIAAVILSTFRDMATTLTQLERVTDDVERGHSPE